jgi:hypothetical protein
MSRRQASIEQQALVGRQFGATADTYLSSSVHSAAADLERLCRIAGELRPARLHAMFTGLPDEARRYFSVAADHSFTIDSAWLEGVKTG